MSNYNLTLTDDGSYTFFSPDFGESYHSRSGAKEEAEKKFIKSCKVAAMAERGGIIRVLDICYGLGYNTAAALAEVERVNPSCRVELRALELDPNIGRLALENNLLKDWGDRVNEVLGELVGRGSIETPGLGARLLLGDARETIRIVRDERWRADAIFLDPFSPGKCPQLWSVEFLQLVAGCLAPEGYLATYSCAAATRAGLMLAGLQVGRTENVGRRSPGTLARHPGEDLPPLSLQEREHLETRAAVPYRDPSLKDSAASISERRRREQEDSPLEISSRWRRRWCRSTP